jgi:hypothetical protein
VFLQQAVKMLAVYYLLLVGIVQHDELTFALVVAGIHIYPMFLDIILLRLVIHLVPYMFIFGFGCKDTAF